MNLAASASEEAITTPEAHAAALRRIDALMAADPAPATRELTELTRLAAKAGGYEKARFTLDLPFPEKAD